ncbi:MAG: TetR/AcrR family transcriptional regulator [Acidimicrobiaceae bacterium]|nr:TetR/AcrR family transcriptional regulator [Acidimicrobiaceae bacterium]
MTSSAAPASARQTKRPRRTSEEVRARLLDAARELFVEQSYDATSTKQIALKAGVAEKVLFGNFSSKAGIFDAAFTEPFADLADEYVAEWQTDAETPAEERIAGFVASLFDLAHRNRTILRAVLTRQVADDDSTPEIIAHVARAIHSLKRVDQAPVPGVDLDAAILAVAGMIFGVVLLDDMLTPPGRRRPSRERLQREMTDLILHGVLHRPVGEETGGQASTSG